MILNIKKQHHVGATFGYMGCNPSFCIDERTFEIAHGPDENGFEMV